ncbi:peptidoglycan-recognition protein SC2-like, partial [Asbolus verrucosus]
SCPTIISRSEWGAKSPKSTKRLKQNPPPYVVIHHSDGAECTSLKSCKSRVNGIQNYHMNNKGWQDIGYNFLIGGDGNVYEGRGWGIWGSHVPKYNSKSIGICVIGNFMNKKPSTQQLTTLENLISCAKENNYIASDYHLIGHRQGSRTSCPGNELFNEIK